MIKKMWVQTRVNNPLCLLEMKDYCPFEILSLKRFFYKNENFNEFF